LTSFQNFANRLCYGHQAKDGLNRPPFCYILLKEGAMKLKEMTMTDKPKSKGVPPILKFMIGCLVLCLLSCAVIVIILTVQSLRFAPQRQAYKQNLSLWESQAIHHYRFDLEIGCNCPWRNLMPLTVEVRNGEIVSMVASNDGDITPYLDTFRPHGTIESLFDRVDSAISMSPYKFEVQYDATYGFPTLIIIDPYRMITDDAIGYYVTNFVVLP
jgi:hypothetical protein